jgi:cytochrome subunit of sulfide dehydrogenase
MHRLIKARARSGLCVVGFLACLSAPSFAQTQQQLYVKSLAATCANCHGTDGLQQDYIVAQMQAFKSGARSATIMHQLSKGYNDAQVAQIAAYFAAQKK